MKAKALKLETQTAIIKSKSITEFFNDAISVGDMEIVNEIYDAEMCESVFILEKSVVINVSYESLSFLLLHVMDL